MELIFILINTLQVHKNEAGKRNMRSLFCQRKRPGILLVMGYAAFFFQVAAWADSPEPRSEKAASAISLNSQEQRTMHEKEVVVRECSTNGKPGKTFEAVAIMEANSGVIQDIVMDYASYPDFMPNVSRVGILRQEDTTARTLCLKYC